MAIITIAQAKIPNWIGTGTGTYYLFLAPNKSIIADGEEVQGSSSLEKAAWYIQVECTVADEVDARGLTVPTLTIPSVKLHSTSDADDPTVKWQMKIARFLSDKATHTILGMFSFRLPASPTSTTWQAIRTYNLAAAEVEAADHLDTYLDEYNAPIVARVEALEEGGASYLVYTALLTQSGTDAPVATVLQNTLGGAVVWARTAQGQYTATLAGAFTVGKTICMVGGLDLSASEASLNTVVANVSANSVLLKTRYIDPSGGSSLLLDGGLDSTPFECRVYP